MPGTPIDPPDDPAAGTADQNVDVTADRTGYRDADAIPSEDLLDESLDSVTDPDVPVADKGSMSRPLEGTDLPANGRSATPPGVRPDELDALDVVEDEPARTEAFDLAEGEMDEEVLTQGQSVVEAEYADRGPAPLDTGVDADGAADVADTEDGDVMTGTRGVRTADDVEITDEDGRRRG